MGLPLLRIYMYNADGKWRIGNTPGDTKCAVFVEDFQNFIPIEPYPHIWQRFSDLEPFIKMRVVDMSAVPVKQINARPHQRNLNERRWQEVQEIDEDQTDEDIVDSELDPNQRARGSETSIEDESAVESFFEDMPAAKERQLLKRQASGQQESRPCRTTIHLGTAKRLCRPVMDEYSDVQDPCKSTDDACCRYRASPEDEAEFEVCANAATTQRSSDDTEPSMDEIASLIEEECERLDDCSDASDLLNDGLCMSCGEHVGVEGECPWCIDSDASLESKDSETETGDMLSVESEDSDTESDDMSFAE